MPVLPSITRRLSRFGRGEGGSSSIEAVIILPLMAWAILACFSYFDGLRQNNINIKAAHTLSDMLSRETVPIDADYLDGMQDVLTYLVGGRNNAALRVSVFQYDEDEEEFVLNWSEGTNGTDGLTEDTKYLVEDRLPVTANGDTIITVETWIDYRALYSYALDDTVLYQFTVTRARYAPQLIFEYADGTTSATADS